MLVQPSQPMSEGETMAHIQGLNSQIEHLRTDVRDGFSGLHKKLEGVVPRSELALVQQRYEDMFKVMQEEQKSLHDHVTILRRWLYIAAGMAAGSIPAGRVVEMLLS